MHKQLFSTLFFGVVFLVLFLAQGSTIAKDEIKITTSSKKALSIFIDARNDLENLQVTKAAKKFDKAIKLDSDFALAHLYRYQTGIGGYNVAQEHLDKAIKLSDKVTRGEKNLIKLSKANSDNDQVAQKSLISKLLKEFPKDKRVHSMAGVYFFGIQDFTTAKKHLKKSIEIDGNFAPAYNMLGYTESSLDNYSSAKEAFMKYIKLIPDKPNPYDSYAELMLKLGNYDESIKYYQKAYDKDNSFTIALLGLGNNYVFMGEFDKARKNYSKVYDKTENINAKMGALYWIATSYVHEGDIDKAISTFERQRALAKKNNLTTNVITSYNLEGFILTEAGRVKDAEKRFNMASEIIKTSDLNPKVKEYYNVMAGINRCYVLTANNKISEANKEAKECLSVVTKRNNPSEIKYLHGNLARLEMAKGNYKKALEHFDQSNTQSPYNWHYMSVAYEKVGNKYKARQYKNKVINSNQNGIGQALVTTVAED